MWDGFGPATRTWIEAAFAEPTPAQVGAWNAIAAGRHALVVAPTLSSLDASGGGPTDYTKLPKGNIDPTGEYFIWTANAGTSRLDAYLVRLPTALPYLLSGMKTAGGLSLIGTVVAEFVAGSGAATGLSWRIIEAGNRLEIATMFAALALLALAGVAIFAALSLLEHALLHRWHESALNS